MRVWITVDKFEAGWGRGWAEVVSDEGRAAERRRAHGKAMEDARLSKGGRMAMCIVIAVSRSRPK